MSQIIRFTDKKTGDTIQTMTEGHYRLNAALPWFHRDMQLTDILDAFNETSLTMRGDIITSGQINLCSTSSTNGQIG